MERNVNDKGRVGLGEWMKEAAFLAVSCHFFVLPPWWPVNERSGPGKAAGSAALVLEKLTWAACVSSWLEQRHKLPRKWILLLSFLFLSHCHDSCPQLLTDQTSRNPFFFFFFWFSPSFLLSPSCYIFCLVKHRHWTPSVSPSPSKHRMSTLPKCLLTLWCVTVN